ncbi:hypothetical protein T07_15126 [Trichinella nelsoni]|uniref:Uncharacterized protein n=1 Tax=Trichinella nelsoni TaxID=6336 RepID=A0A0V0RQG5_9BILA|nr:hypothetical protein T07_15126 [Trichinella nelsoni]
MIDGKLGYSSEGKDILLTAILSIWHVLNYKSALQHHHEIPVHQILKIKLVFPIARPSAPHQLNPNGVTNIKTINIVFHKG